MDEFSDAEGTSHLNSTFNLPPAAANLSVSPDATKHDSSKLTRVMGINSFYEETSFSFDFMIEK